MQEISHFRHFVSKSPLSGESGVKAGFRTPADDDCLCRVATVIEAVPMVTYRRMFLLEYSEMEAEAPQAEITRLLQALRNGEKTAEEKLIPLVYGELRRLARHYMALERADHTLQSTALVHEAYIRLTGQPIEWQGRTHFFALAATMMRRILVDHARSVSAEKRGADSTKVVLEDSIAIVSHDNCDDLLAVHEALTQLEQIDPRQAQVVELRFFAGLDLNEIAELLSVSTRTVRRDWESARVWLYMNLKPLPGGKTAG